MKIWQRRFLISFGFLIELASLGLVIFGFPLIFKLEIWQKEARLNPDEAMVVYFNQPVLISSVVDNFKVEPAIAGQVVLDDWRRRFIFRPNSLLEPGQNYKLVFNGLRSLSMSSFQEASFTFYVDDIFESGQILKPVALPVIRQREPVSGCNPEGPRILFGKYVDINLSKKKIWLYEDGWCRAEYAVAAYGGADRPTPRGQFKVLSKQKNHFSSLSHVWMPWSMQVVGDVFMHGIPYRPDGTRLSGGYSWGCIRIPTDQAEKIYYFVDIGTPVLIH